PVRIHPTPRPLADVARPPPHLRAQPVTPDDEPVTEKVALGTESVTSSPGRDVPYRFDRDTTAAGLQERWADLPAGVETGETASVAGRLMLRRDQGKVAFGTLADSSGRVQLFARDGATPRFDEFTALSLGDWIGVTGEVMTTRRGELSVRVDDWLVLARTRRPFPDKWHGVVDP